MQLVSPGELKRNWRTNWLHCLFEFSCVELQRQAWLGGEGQWCSDFVECIVCYFDDLALSGGYGVALAEGLVYPEEEGAVREFHQAADRYTPPRGDDYAHEAILADPAWGQVVVHARAAWCQLIPLLNEPWERALVQSLESGTWLAGRR